MFNSELFKFTRPNAVNINVSSYTKHVINIVFKNYLFKHYNICWQ